MQLYVSLQIDHLARLECNQLATLYSIRSIRSIVKFQSNYGALIVLLHKFDNSHINYWHTLLNQKLLRKEQTMDNTWGQISGNWKQFSGKVKEQWGELTDDELTAIDGKKDQLVGAIQAKYHKSREDVEREVDEWSNTHSL